MNQSYRYCPNCGTQNPKEANECLKCGLVFSKYKPLSITVEKEKIKKSYFLATILTIVLISFLSYIFIIVLMENRFLKEDKDKLGICNLVIDLENIYKKLPIIDFNQKEKYLKQIDKIEKILSTFPISEDMEKVDIFSQNLKDIKEILLKNKEIDEGLKSKIEERFKKLK